MNLCVALANAYITPLPSSADESNAEITLATQQTAAMTKKGAKSDQQVPVASTGPSGPISAGVKNEDAKSALEVNDLMMNIMNILIDFFAHQSSVNMRLIKLMKKLRSLFQFQYEIVKHYYNYGLLLNNNFNNQSNHLYQLFSARKM